MSEGVSWGGAEGPLDGEKSSGVTVPSMDRNYVTDIVRGMVLARAAQVAAGDGVRTEVHDSSELDLEIRVFVGARSAVARFPWAGLPGVSRDPVIRNEVEATIEAALAQL